MKFKDYDVVKVLHDCKERVQKGDMGSIIMAFEVPNEAYEVEFVNDDGSTKATCTLLPDDLEAVEVSASHFSEQ